MPGRTARNDHNSLDSEAIAEMEVAFSRGFCHGWLDGADPEALVSGRSSAKRGTYLGRVRGVRGERIAVELAGPIRRGDGVVFEGDRSQAAEPGGRMYEVFQDRRSVSDAVSSGVVELAFRYGAIDRAKIHLGQKVWKTDDPQASRRIRKTYAGGRIQRRIPLDLLVEAAVGSRLRVVATAATGLRCRWESPEPLPEAAKHPLTAEMLREQFGRLGKTPYELRRLDAKIDGRPMIPLSVLGKLRHEMVRLLDAAAMRPPRANDCRRLGPGGTAPSRGAGCAVSPLPLGEGLGVRAARRGKEDLLSLSPNCPHPSPLPAGEGTMTPHPSPLPKGEGTIAAKIEPCLHVLCRSMEQVEAALACDASSIIVDFGDLDRCQQAVQIVRAVGARVLLATPRIHKPGESEVFSRLARIRPDGVLVRNLAGLAFFRHMDLPAVADFSLNAVNELTVQWLHAEGAERVTPAYDLNRRRLLDLAAAVPPEWLEVVVASAHAHVSCGILPVLPNVFAGQEPPRLRPPLPTARAAAPRSAGRGTPRAGRQPMPQHGFSCRGRESFRRPARAPQTGRPTLPRGIACGKFGRASAARARGLSLAVWEIMMQGSAPAKVGEDARTATSWWSRRCGGRDVLTLAIPLIVSTASWTVMNFIDRMFLLWHSTDEMAAAMPAGMVHFALVCLPLGVASYVNTFVAQYHGAGHPQRIGPAVWQGVRVGLLCVPLYLAFIPLAPWLFRLVGHEPRMAHLEAIYFQTVAWGAGAEVIAGALSAFFTGLGINRVVMIVDTSAALMNAVLDYGWIFGHFGLPALGIEGAAWATVTSLWFRVAAYAAWMMLPRYRQPYQLWSGRRFHPALFRRLLRYGGPNGLQMLVDIGRFHRVSTAGRHARSGRPWPPPRWPST